MYFYVTINTAKENVKNQCLNEVILLKKLTYLFDFDGTLVDSMPCWSKKMINVLKKKILPILKTLLK